MALIAKRRLAASRAAHPLLVCSSSEDATLASVTSIMFMPKGANEMGHAAKAVLLESGQSNQRPP